MTLDVGEALGNDTNNPYSLQKRVLFKGAMILVNKPYSLQERQERSYLKEP